VVSAKQLRDGVLLLLMQNDMADLAVEDLRRWKCWKAADQVLALKSHDVPIVRRSVLRFALSCPGNAKAAQVVAAWRKQDPDYVAEVEELLQLEAGVEKAP
jgi:hypothetical protein